VAGKNMRISHPNLKAPNGADFVKQAIRAYIPVYF